MHKESRLCISGFESKQNHAECFQQVASRPQPDLRRKTLPRFLTKVSSAAGGEASPTLPTRINGIPLVGNAPSW